MGLVAFESFWVGSPYCPLPLAGWTCGKPEGVGGRIVEGGSWKSGAGSWKIKIPCLPPRTGLGCQGMTVRRPDVDMTGWDGGPFFVIPACGRQAEGKPKR